MDVDQDVDQGAVIGADTPCVSCNYNLRSLPLGAVCAECGTPVSESGDGVRLECADHLWVKRVYVGITLMLWSMVLPLGLVLCLGMAALSSARLPRQWWCVGPVGAHGLWFFLLSMLYHLCWVCWCAGIVVATLREPRTRFDEPVFTLRRILRGCAGAVALSATVSMLVPHDWRGTTSVPLTLTWSGLEIIPILFALLMGLYLAGFAHRTSMPEFKMETISISIWLTLLLLFQNIGRPAMRLGGWDSGSLPPILSALYLVIGVCTIVYLFKYMQVLSFYRRAFRIAAGIGNVQQGARAKEDQEKV